MELKCYLSTYCVGLSAGLNRTFMELKLSGGGKIDFEARGLNRTFMELKFITYFYSLSRSLFKSHLYGIEIDEAELAYKRTVEV